MLPGLSFTEAGKRHESPGSETNVCITTAHQGAEVYMALQSPWSMLHTWCLTAEESKAGETSVSLR